MVPGDGSADGSEHSLGSTPGVVHGAGVLLESKVQLFGKASYPKILREQKKMEIIAIFEFFRSIPGSHKHKPSFNCAMLF